MMLGMMAVVVVVLMSMRILMRAMIMIPLRSPRWPEREYTRSVEDKTRRGRAHLAPPHGNHGDVGYDFDYDYHLAPPMVIMVIMIVMLMMTMTMQTMINIS